MDFACGLGSPKPAEVIIKKLRRLTGFQDLGAAEQQLETLRKAKDEAGEHRWLERYWARMWDVSAFMERTVSKKCHQRRAYKSRSRGVAASQASRSLKPERNHLRSLSATV